MHEPKKTTKPNAPHAQPDAQPDAGRKPRPGVEGEGSYEAARRYDEGVQKTVQSGKVPDLAKKARKAIEGPDKAELIEAEEEGKKPLLPG